jgi:hypothetical protein
MLVEEQLSSLHGQINSLEADLDRVMRENQ